MVLHREVFAAYDKLLLESAATAVGSVVNCPSCGHYSVFEPDSGLARDFKLPPGQLFRCVTCHQVTHFSAAKAIHSC